MIQGLCMVEVSTLVRPHASWLAGVWGEPSPQVPPEARWAAGPAASSLSERTCFAEG
jgi:hypothetical protein